MGISKFTSSFHVAVAVCGICWLFSMLARSWLRISFVPYVFYPSALPTKAAQPGFCVRNVSLLYNNKFKASSFSCLKKRSCNPPNLRVWRIFISIQLFMKAIMIALQECI